MQDRRWYHLSRSSRHERIDGSKGNDWDGPILRLRVPPISHGEEPVPRTCVAPTVWQCASSIGLDEDGSPERRWIYEIVLLEGPDVAPASVGDVAKSDEHWITADTVKRHGGIIALKRLSSVEISRALKLALNIAHVRGQLPSDSDAELDSIWDRTSGEWVLRDDLLVRKAP